MIKNKIWSFSILLFIAAMIGIYLFTHRNLLLYLRDVNLLSISFLVIIRFIFLVLNGVLLREFALKYQITLVPTEWFGLSVVTTMGNFITPFSGGLFARASYLKHKHALPYSKFLSLLGANYMIYFWVVGVAGFITLVLTKEKIFYYYQIMLCFMIVIITISAFIIVPFKKLSGSNRFIAFLNESLLGWVIIKKDVFLLIKLVLFTLCNIILHGLSFWIALSSILGFSYPFKPIFLVSLMSVFSTLGNITPGNIGIQEAVVTISSGIVGIGVGVGLIVSLLIRIATLIPTFILGPIFSFILTRELAGRDIIDSSINK